MVSVNVLKISSPIHRVASGKLSAVAWLGAVVTGCCLFLVTAPANALDDQWAETIAQTAESVVSLQLSQLRAFDDAEQGGSGGTGFVVDAERGIILTNRHIVGSGPVRFSATFQNQERVDAVPLYRDPVHDFAFLRYDPAELQYAKPVSLPLRPDKVSTGLNIRVLGSDGGEQLSILTGTIARVDREVPSYGRYGYNDFNTFYLQAASSTSGGSSGSPVIDFDGDVVALNAAANTRTASSFFLPLYRIQHALARLQQDEEITRGSLQAIFSHKPFRVLRRLGLSEAFETEVRQLDESNTGMLTVAQVLKEGVTDGILAEGDILYAINGEVIANYVQLEDLLDRSIGDTLMLSVVRQGQMMELGSGVADLHANMPDRFLELGDTILQNMSIQHTRAMNLPPTGVVVMRPGFFLTSAGISQSSVLTELDGESVRDIDDVLSILAKPRTRKKLIARYIVPGREFTSSVAQIDINNRWFQHRQCKRVDNARFWDCETVALPDYSGDEESGDVTVPTYKDPLLNRVAPAMVRVDFHIPFSTDNVYAHHFTGIGNIVDKENGIVVVDRNTVPIGLGDAEITFFGSKLLPAQVVFLHPSHNLAFLKYDPKLLGDAEFEALELESEDIPLPAELFMVGYREDGTFRKHLVDDTSRLTVGFEAPSLARFQQSFVDVYGVPNMPPSLGGPLVDESGKVHAVWLSFAYQSGQEMQQQEWAMPAQIVFEALKMYQSGRPFYAVDATLDYRPLALGQQLGMPDEWLQRYLALDAASRRILYVQQLVPDTDAAEQLRVGDVLMAIDGELVANLFTVERVTQKEQVEVQILRSGEVLTLTLKPSTLPGLGTVRLVNWAGASFQQAHREVALFKGVNPEGVYIADTDDGSPALWDRLYRNRFVTAVDGIPVSNLDEFLSQVRLKKQDEITRLSLTSIGGRKGIVSVQPEYTYWPTFEIRRSDSGWERVNYEHPE